MWAPTPNFRPLFGTHAQQQRIQALVRHDEGAVARGAFPGFGAEKRAVKRRAVVQIGYAQTDVKRVRNGKRGIDRAGHGVILP
ncbi:hypothetical protein [Metallibacterium scheffleri]|jgi:hypothetical protein